MLRRVLIVDPDAPTRARLREAISPIAHVCHRPEFTGARSRLFETPFDLLVTNLRLGAYNGLHLVYLVGMHALPARCIVYDGRPDAGLARTVQSAGAFYESLARLPVTLTAYVGGTLPARDRRDPATPDRRARARGGRRCWDRHVASVSP